MGLIEKSFENYLSPVGKNEVGFDYECVRTQYNNLKTYIKNSCGKVYDLNRGMNPEVLGEFTSEIFNESLDEFLKEYSASVRFKMCDRDAEFYGRIKSCVKAVRKLLGWSQLPKNDQKYIKGYATRLDNWINDIYEPYLREVSVRINEAMKPQIIKDIALLCCKIEKMSTDRFINPHIEKLENNLQDYSPKVLIEDYKYLIKINNIKLKKRA